LQAARLHGLMRRFAKDGFDPDLLAEFSLIQP